MSERKRKKKNRLRGNRTMGKGNTKNNRGGGSRGGRGDAGSKKHKRQLYQHEVGALRRLKAKPRGVALNLNDIDKQIEKLLMQKDTLKVDGLVVFDGKKENVEKILGTGKLKNKAFFKNVLASKKAVLKIKNSGAKIDLGKAEESGQQGEFEKEEAEFEENIAGEND